MNFGHIAIKATPQRDSKTLDFGDLRKAFATGYVVMVFGL